MSVLFGIWLWAIVSSLGGTWAPGVSQTLEVPGDVHDAAMVELNGTPHVVLTGTFGTWIVNPITLQTAAERLVRGRSVYVDSSMDPKWPDVLICGDDGVTLLPTTSEGFDESILLILKPCQDLALVDVAFQEYQAPITAHTEVWLWAEDAEGYIRPKTQLGQIKGVPRVKSAGKESAFVGLGSTDVFLFRDNSVIRQPAGGFVGDVVWFDGGWAWSLTDAGVIQKEDGSHINVADTPTRLWSGDLDGDGVVGAIVAHPRTLQLGVLDTAEASEAIHDVGIEPIRLIGGSWNGDSCSDIVVLANERKVLFITGNCMQRAANDEQGATMSPPLVSLGDTPPKQTAEAPQIEEKEGPKEVEKSTSSEPVSPVIQLVPTPLAIPVQEAPPSVNITEKTIAVGAAAWPSVVIEVGRKAELKVVDALGQSSAFAAMGGPPGFIVRSNGSAVFTPKVTHVGRWRVSVRLWENGTWGRRGGFELVVRTADNAVRAQPTVATSTATEEKQAQTGPDLAMGCDLGVGLAVGGTNVSENWAFIDQSVQGSASPMVSFSCRKGQTNGFVWFAGIDSAPGFVFFNNELRFRHSLVGTFGLSYFSDSFRVGPFASLGYTLIGGGLRVGVYPFRMKNGYRHGFELRGMVFPQQQFAGQISLMYTFDVTRIW